MDNDIPAAAVCTVDGVCQVTMSFDEQGRRAMKREYSKPGVLTEKSFETSALSCAKTTDPPPGSWHFASAYDTFTGHLGGGFGTSASAAGSTGIGYGPGGTSQSYIYTGMCGNWVTYSS